MNWALDPRQPRRSTAAPEIPAAKKTARKQSPKAEEE